MVIAWLAPDPERSTTSASPITWSSVISAVVMPFLNTCSGESMWAPVCRLWFTLETCQKPGPRRCGVTSSFMLVEGGLKVFSSTVTDRSMNWLMVGLSGNERPKPTRGAARRSIAIPRFRTSPRRFTIAAWPPPGLRSSR